MRLRAFLAVDGLTHWLHGRGLVGERLLARVCDRFDLWLGASPEELNRKV